jgi:tight adherence protein C
MNGAALLGAIAGFGCVGILLCLRSTTPSLHAVALAVDRPVDPTADSLSSPDRSMAVGRWGIRRITADASWISEKWASLAPSLAITGESPERMVSKGLVLGGAGLLIPPLLWIAAPSFGLNPSIGAPAVAVVVVVPIATLWPIASMLRRARTRQQHVRVVTGSFVDLVVLGLAGGVGVEGALMAAALVSSDWAAKRILRTLLMARDSGLSPWVALGDLGMEIGVGELVELSATIQLAGTEGARIRRSLSARAVSLRRHEQAEAESAANAMTERLFIPGALLLVGFLLFVGYPAFSRILGGL